MESAIFMIEGGKALEMVKEHIADRQRVQEEVSAMLEELGVSEYSASRTNGVLFRVVFSGVVHQEFCKATGSHGLSSPRKGSSWGKRFMAVKGYKEVAPWIAETFGVPCQISYKYENGHGSRHIGNIFNEFGFLYLGADGPYAMWTPDVPAEVAQCEAIGYTVEEPAKSFVLDFDGCRRIEKEEWEILALQHKLDKQRRAKRIAETGKAVTFLLEQQEGA